MVIDMNMTSMYSIFYMLVLLEIFMIGFAVGWILHKELYDGEITHQCTSEHCDRDI